MPRPSVTLDVYAALAAPKRRQILELLGSRKLPVTQLVDELRLPQPVISKHLAVLRRVGLVRVERLQRQMIYELDPTPLKSVHDWTQIFQPMWSNQLTRIKARAESIQRASTTPTSKPPT